MPSVRVRAPAKVNLHLAVGPLRDDGFHDITTVFHALDLFDDVTATEAEELTIAVHGPPEVPTDERNLAWQAAELIAAHVGVPPNVHLTIDKAIPVAAGMAGGSADAAAALVACAELWRARLDRTELVKLAARLGSDVGFALLGGTALGTGRGELLSPVLAPGRYHWVLAFADRGIATATAYQELDKRRSGARVIRPAGAPDAVIDALRSGDPHRLAPTLANDLQPIALTLMPSLRRTLAAGKELGALAGVVSGSGPTCAFLVSTADAATRLAAALPGEAVCRSTRVATSPAPGARVIR